MKPTYEELEAKCAALAAKINVIKELMEVAEQINKLAQEETEKLAHERNMLAAELSAVDKIHNEAVFITDDHYEQSPSEVQKMIRSLAALQIPATDAFLAEVRASEAKHVYDSILDNPAVTDMGSLVDWLEQYSNDYALFAAQLRQGGEHE